MTTNIDVGLDILTPRTQPGQPVISGRIFGGRHRRHEWGQAARDLANGTEVTEDFGRGLRIIRDRTERRVPVPAPAPRLAEAETTVFPAAWFAGLDVIEPTTARIVESLSSRRRAGAR